jgi:hypothetical protein
MMPPGGRRAYGIMMPDTGRPAAGGRSDSVDALGTTPAISLELSDSMPALGQDIIAICTVCRRRRHYAATAAAGRAAANTATAAPGRRLCCLARNLFQH